MSRRHLSRDRAIAITGLLAATGALAACSAGPMPPAERPEVVWADGEPTGPLEDNPWVRAARASDLELNIATNTRDFTDPALDDHSTAEMVGNAIGGMENAASSEEWFYFPGPTPMIPVRIKESRDGKRAEVYFCEAAWWILGAGESKPEPPLQGRFAKMTMVYEGGSPKVDKRGQLFGEVPEILIGKKAVAPFVDDREGSDCKLDDAKIGLFDPAPDVTLEYTEDDIKRGYGDARRPE